MRLLLVGIEDERARLRAELENSSFTIAAEFATLAKARASGIDADGILIAGTGAARTFHPSTSLGMNLSLSKGQVREIDDDDIDDPLTPREIDVVELLAEGLSNKALAARLGISDQTVKFHVASLSGKLGAANRTDAVRRAVRRGLISL